jgi:hypothetical protein
VRPGDWPTRSREAGKLADPGPQPDKAPFISYMKGALLHSAAERIPVTRDTPTDAFMLPAFQVCHAQGWPRLRAGRGRGLAAVDGGIVQVGMTSILPPTRIVMITVSRRRGEAGLWPPLPPRGR